MAKSQPGGAKVIGAAKGKGGKATKPAGGATKMGGSKGQKGK